MFLPERAARRGGFRHSGGSGSAMDQSGEVGRRVPPFPASWRPISQRVLAGNIVGTFKSDYDVGIQRARSVKHPSYGRVSAKVEDNLGSHPFLVVHIPSQTTVEILISGSGARNCVGHPVEEDAVDVARVHAVPRLDLGFNRGKSTSAASAIICPNIAQDVRPSIAV